MGLPSNTNALQNGFAQGYQIGRSLRFRSSASAYLNRTPSASNRQTWTWSGWVKRGIIGASQYQLFGAYIGSGTTDTNYFAITYYLDKIEITGYSTVYRSTTQVFRDPSAWYHLVVALDTTQATASNRVKLYINGVQVTAFATSNDPALNSNLGINGNYPHGISAIPSNAAYFDGYLAEVNFIDGQQLTPSSFGIYDSNGIWQPIKYTGTYGTNGFYLPFSNTTSTTTLVADASGNGNNWTPNNISLTSGTTYDSMIDSPTNSSAAANYAVGNPLNPDGSTWSSGNLNFSLPNGTGNSQATFAVSSGKWYWEVVYTAQPNYTGVQQAGLTTRFTNGVLYGSAGDKSVNGTTSAYGATYTNGDIIGVALDMDGSTVTFYKNSVSQGSISLSGVGITNATFSLSAGGGATSTGSVNFGQRPFTYTPPSGYNALNTANLPQPLISNGANYMAATLITGTGGSQTLNNGTNTTIGTTFQPDLVWWKSRSNVTNNILVNSITGVNPFLRSNTTGAEDTPSGMTSFNSNGFSVNGSFDNTYTFVAWQWKAGAGTTSTNTSGSITSTVSVSAQSGFSIATYTGTGANATVGHGLGTVPSFMIIKNRSSGTTDWRVWSSSFSAPTTGYLALNTTAAGANATTMWNSSLPTSSVINLGSSNSVNGSGNNIIAYCFSAVRGFSAFGSYTGNGSADGPFIYTGFRPRFVLLKDSSAAQNWRLFDSSRSTYNPDLETLFPNLTNAESTAETGPDFLSNGFKIRTSSATHNASGNTIIYAAFAENPFQIARAR